MTFPCKMPGRPPSSEITDSGQASRSPVYKIQPNRRSGGGPSCPTWHLDRDEGRVSIRTRRWNDPIEADDGFRLLVTRYRPRALRKENETWDAWQPDLGPSRELHADFWGKHGPPITWTAFRRRYLGEMRSQG